MLGGKKEEKMTEKKNGLDYIGASFKRKIWMTVPEMGKKIRSWKVLRSLCRKRQDFWEKDYQRELSEIFRRTGSL